VTPWFWTSYVALWALVVVQGGALFALYHHFGQMYLSSPQGRQHQGPDLGRLLPQVELEDLDGQLLAVPTSPSILIFADTECRICSELKPVMTGFALEHPDVELAVICAADSETLARQWAGTFGESVRVIPDIGKKLSSQLRIGVTPFMVAVDAAGRVCDKGVPNGLDGLLRARNMTRQDAPVIVKGG
jgi:hypothetical protein